MFHTDTQAPTYTVILFPSPGNSSGQSSGGLDAEGPGQDSLAED